MLVRVLIVVTALWVLECVVVASVVAVWWRRDAREPRDATPARGRRRGSG